MEIDTTTTRTFTINNTGTVNIGNAATALAVAAQFGVRPADAVKHLAAVTSVAGRYAQVERDGRSEVAIEPLSGAARAGEIARMLGGEAMTPAVRRHAAELLERMRAARRSK